MHRALIPCALALLAATSRTQDLERFPTYMIGDQAVHRACLPCGLEVLAVPDHSQETVNMFVVYATGTRQESPGSRGLAHLTEHVMFAGTPTVAAGEHDERVQGLGAQSNAYTRADYTLYYDYQLPADSWTEALALEADRMVNLSFPEEGFAKEHQALVDEEVRTYGDGMKRHAALAALAFPDHPYGLGVMPGEQNSDAPQLTLEQTRTFYRTHYRPDRACLVVAGNVTADRAFEEAVRAFAAVPAPVPPPVPPPAPRTPRGERVLERMAFGENTAAMVGYVFPGLRSHEHQAAVVLERYLGGRLAAAQAGSASVGGEERVDPRLCVLSLERSDTDTDPEQLLEVIDAVVQKVREGEVDREAIEELIADEAERYLEQQVFVRPYFSLPASLGILEALGDSRQAADWQDDVEILDPEDILAVARRYLVTENSVVLLCEAKPTPPRPWIGVRLEEEEGQLRILEAVPDSPAQAAGLQADDLILEIAGHNITDMASLRAALEGRAVGDEVVLRIRRGEGELEVTLTLGARPEGGATQASPMSLYQRAQGLAREGKVEEAVALYDQLAQQSGDRTMKVIYLHEKGGLLARTGELEQAVEALEEALAIVDYPATRELLEEVQAELARQQEAPPEEPAAAPPAPAATATAAVGAGAATGQVTVTFAPGTGPATLTVDVETSGELRVTTRNVVHYEIHVEGGASGAEPTPPTPPGTDGSATEARPEADPVPVRRHTIRISRLELAGSDDHLEATDTLDLAHQDGGVVVFQLPDLEVARVTPDQVEVRVLPEGRYELRIPAGVERLQVSYRGRLTAVAEARQDRGVYLGGKPWYPRVEGEELATHRLKVRLPEGWDCCSDGRRRVVSQDTVAWISTHPTDGLSLMAGPFELTETRHGAVDLYGFFFPEEAHLAAGYLESAARYLELYGDWLGPYPYRKFAVVENFLPTGYGMPSWTLLGDQVVRLPFIVDTSLGHEICHNWWGNGIFVDPEQGNWCEGLTTYCADHLYKERESAAAAANHRKGQLARLGAYVTDENAIPLTEFRSRTDDLTQAIGYDRCSMVFHMLRQAVGEESFRDGLQRLYQEHLFQRISWDQIAAVFSEAHGQDLVPWFRAWVEGTGAPRLELLDAGFEPDGSGGHAHVTLQATGGPAGLELAVPVAIALGEGDERRQLFEVVPVPIHPEGQRVTRRWAVPAPVTSIQVDPAFDLLRRLDPREVEPSVAQVKGAEHAIAVFDVAGDRAMMAAYGKVAAALGVEDHRRWRPLGSLDRAAARSTPALYLGVDGSAEGLEWLPAREQVLGEGGGSGVVAGRSPEDPAATWLCIQATSQEEAETLARKIVHYGRYGVLRFAAGGACLEKELQAAGPSPLSWEAPVPPAPEASPVSKAPRVKGFRHLREETFTAGGQTHLVQIYRCEALAAALGLAPGETAPDCEFVLLGGETFTMGSPPDEACRQEDEGPQREVTIAPFLLGRTEVSQRAWAALAAPAEVPPHPATFHRLGEQAPVETISWGQARSWCEVVGLRLPSEAEWEYACRAGTTSPYSLGETVTTEQVNFCGLYPHGGGPAQEYRQQPVPVGSLPPNALGLHEIHGNLREWCEDSYVAGYEGAPTDGSARVDPGAHHRVIRGGSWATDALFCRSADRFWCDPARGFDFLGLRPACSLSR